MSDSSTSITRLGVVANAKARGAEGLEAALQTLRESGVDVVVHHGPSGEGAGDATRWLVEEGVASRALGLSPGAPLGHLGSLRALRARRAGRPSSRWATCCPHEATSTSPRDASTTSPFSASRRAPST